MTPVTAGFLLTALLGGLWTGVAVLYSHAAKKSVRPVGFYVVAAIVACPLAWLVVADWQTLAKGLPQSVMPLGSLMAFAGLFNVGLQLLLLHTISIGHRSTVWTISQSALVVPFLVAWLWWQEPIGWVEMTGVAAVLAGVALLGMGGKHQSAKGGPWRVFALVCFFGVGAMHVMNIIPSHEAAFQDFARLRTPLSLTAYFAGIAVVAAARRIRPSRAECLFGAAYGLIVVASAVTMYRALDLLAESHRAGLVFPLAVGISIIGFLLVDGHQAGGLSGWKRALVFSLILGGIAAIAMAQFN